MKKSPAPTEEEMIFGMGSMIKSLPASAVTPTFGDALVRQFGKDRLQRMFDKAMIIAEGSR